MKRTAVVMAVLLVAGCAPATTAEPPVDELSVQPQAPPGHGAAPDDVQVDEHAPIELGGVVAMWARGGLDVAVVADARRIEGVTAAAFVRSDTLGLTGARAADGTIVDELDAGYLLPVRVTAVDPADYAATVTDPSARAAISTLRTGEVLLSETGARLRGIGPGGHIDLEGLQDLLVVGVVTDELVRRAEIIAHIADADAMGIGEQGSLIASHELDDTAELVAALTALADTEFARVVDARTHPRHDTPLVLSLAQIKERFGEFAYRPRTGVREIDIERAFVDEHIVSEQVPVLGQVTCHRAIMDDLRSAIDEVIEAGLAEHLAPSRYGGCFYPRRIRTDSARLSSHAWGISIDINVDLSLPGLGPVPPDEFIDIFGRNGFRWGGDFLTPDHHHYEWVGDAASVRPDRPSGS